MKQEQAASVLRLVLEVLAEIDAVVGWFARLPAAVVPSGGEALHDGILQTIQLGLGEVPHPGREVLELIGKHPPHFHLHPVYIAHQETDLPVARQRQQRAIAEERERLPVRDHLDGCGVGLG